MHTHTKVKRERLQEEDDKVSAVSPETAAIHEREAKNVLPSWCC